MQKYFPYVSLRAGAGAIAIAIAGVLALLFLAGCSPAAKDKTPNGGGVDNSAAIQDSAGPDSAPAAKAAETTRGSARTVLFIGTSLTAGLGLEPDQAYPALIQARADSAGIPITAVNAGVSGETTAGALNRIDWVMRGPADIVVVETGANDALRALPVAEARDNIAKILDRIKAAKPAAKVLLVQMEAPPNLGQQYARAFHGMYGELARKKGVTLIPFLLAGVAGHADLNQTDGLHPNVRGERIVATNVWTALKPVITGGGTP